MTISIEDDHDGVRVCISEERGRNFLFFRRVDATTVEETTLFSAVGFIPTLSEECEVRKNARIALAKREAVIAIM